MNKKLSIIIPVYNEQETISLILKKIRELDVFDLEKEIIVVDDGSTDDVKKILEKEKEIKVFFHKENKGKGGAIKTGLKNITGDFVIIQDADLEYDPEDIKKCIKPILENQAKVVYGSREMENKNKIHSNFFFFLGGKTVTWWCNLLYHSKLTDEPTCYKCFETKTLKAFDVENNGFGWEPEITAKILKRGIKIKEVPISYFPRKKGKKITYWDGFKTFGVLLKYRFKK